MPEITLQRRGILFVLSSPSGAGKTTLSRRLLERYRDAKPDERMVMSVSITTRLQRPGEEHGRDYFFLNRSEYNQMVATGEMLEHAEVFGNCYGTPAYFVQDHVSQGIDVLFDIDWQGTRQLAQQKPEDVVSVFILPPSMVELERRLCARAQDSKEVVATRMSKAASEISHWYEYDYVLVNQDVDAILERIDTILRAERLKRERQVGLTDFVSRLQ